MGNPEVYKHWSTTVWCVQGIVSLLFHNHSLFFSILSSFVTYADYIKGPNVFNFHFVLINSPNKEVRSKVGEKSVYLAPSS
jgi:hypothetical protein